MFISNIAGFSLSFYLYYPFLISTLFYYFAKISKKSNNDPVLSTLFYY